MHYAIGVDVNSHFCLDDCLVPTLMHYVFLVDDVHFEGVTTC